MTAPEVATLFAAIGAPFAVREFVRYHRAVEAERRRRIIQAAERDGRVAR